MRDIYRDAQKVVLSLLAGLLLYFVLWGGVPFGLGFLTGRYTSPEITALRDTIRLTDSIVQVRTETVTVVQRRVDTVRKVSDSLDTLVVIRDDSTVQTPDTVAVIPPVVVANLAALRITVAVQDTLIRALYQRDTTQQWRIDTRDKLIRELSKPQKCGRRCGYLLGLATTAGLVYLVK